MKFIKGDVNIVNRGLTVLPNLKDVTVEGFFDCSANMISSLEGCPETVLGNFYCSDNRLTSLEGCPKEVGGNFYCSFNVASFTREQVRAVCNVTGKIFV